MLEPFALPFPLPLPFTGAATKSSTIPSPSAWTASHLNLATSSTISSFLRIPSRQMPSTATSMPSAPFAWSSRARSTKSAPRMRRSRAWSLMSYSSSSLPATSVSEWYSSECSERIRSAEWIWAGGSADRRRRCVNGSEPRVSSSEATSCGPREMG